VCGVDFLRLQTLVNKEYYHNDIERILEGIVASLWSNPNRTFVWAETSFLALWLARRGSANCATCASKQDRPITWRHALQHALDTGQLEIVGGGWVQHDEALTTLSANIDQLTLGSNFESVLLFVLINQCISHYQFTGHRFLVQQLNVVPRVAYHIGSLCFVFG
jgi:hypothetical protein